jgi:hypothetical protein
MGRVRNMNAPLRLVPDLPPTPSARQPARQPVSSPVPSSVTPSVAPSGQSAFLKSFQRDLIAEVLADRGVHRDDVTTLTRWAPLALTSLCWRNTVIEERHCDPTSTLSDGAMLMANVDTTRTFTWAMSDLWRLWEIDQHSCLDDVSDIEADSLEAVLLEYTEDLLDPTRLMPHGVLLGEVAGEELTDLSQHMHTQVTALAEAAEEDGTDVVLMWLALRGMSACANWWGGPAWPRRVDEWLRLVDEPAHEFWSGTPLPPAPGLASDREWLRYTLLTGPDRLGVEVADWCTQEGRIGSVRPDRR